jgi:hypothetical protein
MSIDLSDLGYLSTRDARRIIAQPMKAMLRATMRTEAISPTEGTFHGSSPGRPPSLIDTLASSAGASVAFEANICGRVASSMPTTDETAYWRQNFSK